MTILYMVLTLGIMVLVHELGHFIAARFFKIGVPVFSIGMGKRLFGVKRGGTDYRFSVLPFGGYVKLKGMEDFDGTDRDGDDFMAKHPIKRMLVIFFGPFANFLLAFLLMFAMVFFYGVSYMPNTPVYSALSPYDTLFFKGDSVMSVNGNAVLYYTDIFKFLKPNETNSFELLRGNEVTRVEFKLDKPDSFAIYPEIKTKIGTVSSGSPAERAGIMKGDIILSVDSSKTRCWQDMAEIIKVSCNRSLSLTILRGGDTLVFNAVPESREEKSGDSTLCSGFLGVGYSSEMKRPSFIQSASITFERISYLSLSLVKFLSQLFTGRMSVKNLGGPISIYTMTGESLKWGFDSFLAFVAFFSLNLFIFNLIPFPPLDGSYIIIFLFETLFRKKATTKFMTVYQQIGYLILMGLVVLVSFNDILRLVVK